MCDSQITTQQTTLKTEVAHLNIWQLAGLLGHILVSVGASAGAAAAVDDAVEEAKELVLELSGEVGHGRRPSNALLELVTKQYC